MCVFDGYPRDANECCISAIEEGAIEDLQSEGEILQREERNRDADGEEQALQGGQQQGQKGGAQVRLPLRLSWGRRNS